jgi:hypothetical protein
MQATTSRGPPKPAAPRPTKRPPRIIADGDIFVAVDYGNFITCIAMCIDGRVTLLARLGSNQFQSAPCFNLRTHEAQHLLTAADAATAKARGQGSVVSLEALKQVVMRDPAIPGAFCDLTREALAVHNIELDKLNGADGKLRTCLVMPDANGKPPIDVDSMYLGAIDKAVSMLQASLGRVAWDTRVRALCITVPHSFSADTVVPNMVNAWRSKLPPQTEVTWVREQHAAILAMQDAAAAVGSHTAVIDGGHGTMEMSVVKHVEDGKMEVVCNLATNAASGGQQTLQVRKFMISKYVAAHGIDKLVELDLSAADAVKVALINRYADEARRNDDDGDDFTDQLPAECVEQFRSKGQKLRIAYADLDGIFAPVLRALEDKLEEMKRACGVGIDRVKVVGGAMLGHRMIETVLRVLELPDDGHVDVHHAVVRGGLLFARQWYAGERVLNTNIAEKARAIEVLDADDVPRLLLLVKQGDRLPLRKQFTLWLHDISRKNGVDVQTVNVFESGSDGDIQDNDIVSVALGEHRAQMVATLTFMASKSKEGQKFVLEYVCEEDQTITFYPRLTNAMAMPPPPPLPSAAVRGDGASGSGASGSGASGSGASGGDDASREAKRRRREYVERKKKKLGPGAFVIDLSQDDD